MTGPGFRGCPFINAAAEYPGADGRVRKHTGPADRKIKTLADYKITGKVEETNGVWLAKQLYELGVTPLPTRTGSGPERPASTPT